MILQQYYTSTNKPLRGSAGFGIRAQSAGIDISVEQMLAAAGAYFHPSDLPDTAIEQMPISLSYYTIGDGLWGITHSKYVGQDYSKTRYGNYFSHSLLCNEIDLQGIAWMPISLYGSQSWVTAEETSIPHELPALANLPARQTNMPVDLSLFINQTPERIKMLRQLIQAYVDAHTSATGRRIVICDDYANSVNWIKAMSYSLPTTLRKAMSFTTYQQYQQFVSGGTYLVTCVEHSSHFTPSQYQFDYFVFHQIDKQISPGIEPQDAAILLADAIKMGDQHILQDYNELFEILGCTSPADMDVLALIYRMNTQPLETLTDEVVQRVCSFLVTGNENTRSIRLEAIHNYTKSAMLGNNLNKLKILLPTFHQLSQGYAEDVFVNECVKFLQLQMETASGIDTCELYVIELASIEALTLIVRESTTPSDWIGFLKNSNPDEATLRKWMRFLGYVAFESGRRGQNLLWKALANWSERHQSMVYIEMISPLIATERLELPLAFLRELISISPEINGNQGATGYVRARVDLIKHGVKSQDSGCSQDIITLVDYIYSKRDISQYFQIILDNLTFSPEAIVYVTANIRRKAPQIENQCIGLIALSTQDLLPPLLIAFANSNTESVVAIKIIDAIGDSQKLLALLKAIINMIDSQPSDRVVQIVTTITQRVVNGIQRIDDIDALLRSMRSPKNYIEAHGYLLITKARLTPELLVYSSEEEIRAMSAVSKQYFDAMSSNTSRDIKRAYLSYCASLLNYQVMQNYEWKSIVSEYLEIPSLYVDNVNTYAMYVGVAYESVANKHFMDIGEKFADIFVTTMKDEFSKQLCELFAEKVKQVARRSSERKDYLLAVLKWYEQRPSALSAIQVKSFAIVLKILDKRDIDSVDASLRRVHRSGQFLNWWSECHYEATVSIVQRFKDLFSRGD